MRTQAPTPNHHYLHIQNNEFQVLFGTPEFVAPEVVNFDTISFATGTLLFGQK